MFLEHLQRQRLNHLHGKPVPSAWPLSQKFFQISNLNLPWDNLRSFPLVLSLVTWKKRPTPTLSQSPFRSLITPKTPCLTFCCHSRIETIIRFCATSETLHRCFIYSQMILDGCHYMKKYLFPKAYMERVKWLFWDLAVPKLGKQSCFIIWVWQ